MRESTRLRAVNAVAVVLLAAAVVTIGGGLLLRVRPLAERGAAPSGVSSAPSAQEPAVKDEPVNFLLCGIDSSSRLTDVILLCRIDPAAGHIRLLQIPRDTYVGQDVPSHKYNAVYSHAPKGVSGMETLRARVAKDFGIPVAHYATVTTAGFRRLVDAAGGVDLTVPVDMDYDDPGQNLHIHLKKGPQHLDGGHAEQFVRDRHDWAMGDMGRLQAQKIFLAAFADKLRALGTVALATRVLPAVSAPDFLTDMSAGQMLALYQTARKIDMSRVTVATMPGGYYTAGGVCYYSPDMTRLLALLNGSFVPAGTTLTRSDLGLRESASGGEDTQSAAEKDFQSLVGSD